MIDLALTSVILLILVAALVYKAKIHPEENPAFFDMENTKAMRGFWAVIVVLVHVPAAYQNTVQDLVSSFGFIGVTFFFMTSAYGLTLGIEKRPSGIKTFWRDRLPKLLVPQFLANIVLSLLSLVLVNRRLSLNSFIGLNSWLKFLLLCYLIFWVVHLFCRDRKRGGLIVCMAVASASMLIYWLKYADVIKTTTWATELYGFIWGVLLALAFSRAVEFAKEKWMPKTAVFCAMALVLGVLYVFVLKQTVFFGDYLLKILLGFAITAFILLINSKISIGNKAIAFLGEISFEIYLVHGRVFDVLAVLFPKLSSGVFIIIGLSISIVLAAAIHCVSALIIKQVYRLPWFKKSE